jgi:ribonuclease VapC
MVIDSSAVLALLFNEPEADGIEVAIDEDPVRLMSAASGLEAAIVVEARLGDAGGREFDLLLHKAGIELVAVTGEQVEVARSAWRRFGRGRHEANLNFGDCFSYALAAVSGEPLLFKGDDFSRTDVAKVTLGRE